MKVTKKVIASYITEEANISRNDSMSILNEFIELVIDKTSKNELVKISNFGSFKRTLTKKRVGRNPRTKKEYIIRPSFKVSFNASHKLRETLNK